MYKKLLSISLLLAIASVSFAQSQEEHSSVSTPTGELRGSLILPQGVQKFPVVILLPGSGPTDRNGNNAMGVTANSYRLLAEQFAKQKIATLLIDKRGISESAPALKQEDSIRFDNYVSDAVAWKRSIETDPRVTKVFIAGHSEGSLIGILAAQQTPVAGFISISGPAKSADKIIIGQLQKQAPFMAPAADSMFNRLKKDQPLDTVPNELYAILRKSIQPYMASWMKYTPCTEIAKLTVPVLIVQGSTDMQVETSEAKALKECQPKAELHIIQGMNHILKNASSVMSENIATYKMPALSVNEDLVTVIVNFVGKQ
ncbi:alpha/beta hydrolase [Pinibacter soli]|uniref:Alpha/beta fold hydrolase n=1 Tax=Pinibacter soli TaxID=3044211 RepID=A0ABT6R843_9BACT|nr:alpha/beta fold hydrolase [Pinibacter soli]MDI3318576.1 alpha/beta fold hydrolase [Pinibacter soli]